MERAAVGEAKSGAACAKNGASGRMQRPPELVPIPESLQKASESSGKLLHFGKIPKKNGQDSAKLSKILANFAKFL